MRQAQQMLHVSKEFDRGPCTSGTKQEIEPEEVPQLG
jgi:hypothetical protein